MPKSKRFFAWAIGVILSSAGLNALDLLVVAPNEFKAPCSQFIAHKVAMGWDAEFMALETLLVMAGEDDPEKIKKAFHLFYKKLGLKYVFIVGDSDQFPIRYSAQAADAPVNDPEQYLFTASDLYYADLEHHNDADFGHANGAFSSWNHAAATDVDQSYWGQIHKEGEVNYDEMDMIPEIVVGRLPASSVEEVQVYVNKVIAYESAPHSSKRAIVIGKDDDIDSRSFTEAISGVFKQSNLAVSKLYAPDIRNEHDVCQHLETPQIVPFNLALGSLFLGLSAHGSPDGWSFLKQEQVDDLVETSKLPVMFFSSCDVGRYTIKSSSIYEDIEGDVVYGHGGLLKVFGYDSANEVLSNRHSSEISEAMNFESAQVANEASVAYSMDRMRIQRSGLAAPNVMAVATPDFVEEHGVELTIQSIDLNERKTLVKLRVNDRRNPFIQSADFDGVSGNHEHIVMVSTAENGACWVEVFELSANSAGSYELNRVAFNRKPRFSAAGMAVSDFDGDGLDEIALLGQTSYEQERLYVMDWNGGLVVSDGNWVEIQAEELGGLDSGNVDDDQRSEMLISYTDSLGRVVGQIYEFKTGYELFSLKHETVVSNATLEKEVLLASIDDQYRSEAFITCKDSKGQLCVLAYEVIPDQFALSRLGSIRHADCNFPKLASGNFDNEGGRELVFVFRDSSYRTRQMVYHYAGNGAFKKIGDVAEKGSSIPADVEVLDISFDGIDDPVLLHYHPLRFPVAPNPVQPEELDLSCISESLLLSHENKGAIAVIACNTGSQRWGKDLGINFFDQYRKGERIAGDMWKQSIIDYFNKYPRGSLSVTQDQRDSNNRWTVGATLFQPAKFTFFGDPTLKMP